MSWQKCPICEGSGVNPNTTVSSAIPNSFTHPCPTCQGAKIISEATGKPPINHITHSLCNANIDYSNG